MTWLVVIVLKSSKIPEANPANNFIMEVMETSGNSSMSQSMVNNMTGTEDVPNDPG